MKQFTLILKSVLGIAALVAFTASAQDVGATLAEASYICCVDGGGTKTELQVVDNTGAAVSIFKNGELVSSISVAGSNINTIGEEEVQQRFNDLFDGMSVGRKQLALDSVKSDTVVFAGLAGAGAHSETIRGMLENLGFSPGNIFVYSDAGLMLQAFTPGEILLISGTGSACIGKQADGSQVLRGGLGRVLGDEGSGYYMGKQAIKRTQEINQEQGDQSSLASIITEHFSIEKLGEVTAPLQQGKISADEVAALAPHIFREAHAGDECAKQIVNTASEDLGLLLHKMMNSLACDEQSIYLTGGTFKGEYRDAFIQSICESEAFAKTFEEKRPEITLLVDQNPAVVAALKLLEQRKAAV